MADKRAWSQTDSVQGIAVACNTLKKRVFLFLLTCVLILVCVVYRLDVRVDVAVIDRKVMRHLNQYWAPQVNLTYNNNDRPSPRPTSKTSLGPDLKTERKLGPELKTVRKPWPGLKEVGCKDTLLNSVPGEWVPRQYAQKELNAINKFFSKTRGYHKIPLSLQRIDGKCGNVSFGATVMHTYQALCNPSGPTPCCHSNHTCVSPSAPQCQCDGCFDVRKVTHAELADWTPEKKDCKLNTYRGEAELCPLLSNLTVHFMGDSYSRQMYIAFLQAIRDGHPDGLFAYSNISRGVIRKCDHYFTYFRSCKFKIPTNVTACGGSLHIRHTHLFHLGEGGKKLISQVTEYKNQPNTVMVLWIGAWDHFQIKGNEKHVFTPLKKLMQNVTWPHVIWAAAHDPGYLNPRLYTGDVLRFNNGAKKILGGMFPILDSNPLTSRARIWSYDGRHYGPGVNGVKVNILFNYLNELKHTGMFS